MHSYNIKHFPAAEFQNIFQTLKIQHQNSSNVKDRWQHWFTQTDKFKTLVKVRKKEKENIIISKRKVSVVHNLLLKDDAVVRDQSSSDHHSWRHQNWSSVCKTLCILKAPLQWEGTRAWRRIRSIFSLLNGRVETWDKPHACRGRRGGPASSPRTPCPQQSSTWAWKWGWIGPAGGKRDDRQALLIQRIHRIPSGVSPGCRRFFLRRNGNCEKRLLRSYPPSLGPARPASCRRPWPGWTWGPTGWTGQESLRRNEAPPSGCCWRHTKHTHNFKQRGGLDVTLKHTLLLWV